jgi:type II secretion system protein H
MSPHERDSGFTMIELLVTISLLGIMMAIAVGGYSSWAKASGQSGQARELQSVMRQAQQRAITEGRAICLQFTGTQSYTVYRGACDSASKVKVMGPIAADSANVHFTSPSFTGTSGASNGVTFNARGTAWAGSVRVTRTGSSKVYTLSVEGLTGRVSLS